MKESSMSHISTCTRGPPEHVALDTNNHTVRIHTNESYILEEGSDESDEICERL
jgi:hypothetical protein